MKQASGLLGTRGCPGLTISKPKKLKVRSNAARKKKGRHFNTWFRNRSWSIHQNQLQVLHQPFNAEFTPTSIISVLVETNEHMINLKLFFSKLQKNCKTVRQTQGTECTQAKEQGPVKPSSLVVRSESQGLKTGTSKKQKAKVQTWGTTLSHGYTKFLKGELQRQTQNEACFQWIKAAIATRSTACHHRSFSWFWLTEQAEDDLKPGPFDALLHECHQVTRLPILEKWKRTVQCCRPSRQFTLKLHFIAPTCPCSLQAEHHWVFQYRGCCCSALLSN